LLLGFVVNHHNNHVTQLSASWPSAVRVASNVQRGCGASYTISPTTHQPVRALPSVHCYWMPNAPPAT